MTQGSLVLPLVVVGYGGDDDKMQTTTSYNIQMAPCLKLLMEKKKIILTNVAKLSPKKTASRFVCLITIKQGG